MGGMEGDIAAVLAGGGSERMGGPKANLRIDGTTFLERIVDVLLEAFDTVYVCGGDTEVPGANLVHDPVLGGGPLGGIASALRVAGDGCVFITAVDMPLLDLPVIRRLAEPPVGRGHVRIARVDGRLQPLCGMYPGDLEELAMAHLRSADRSVMGFVRDVPHLELVDVTDGSLRNVNTQADYDALIAGPS
jgi:molybdopterin-guanine dinucleotide biosynthesis protein A